MFLSLGWNLRNPETFLLLWIITKIHLVSPLVFEVASHRVFNHSKNTGVPAQKCFADRGTWSESWTTTVLASHQDYFQPFLFLTYFLMLTSSWYAQRILLIFQRIKQVPTNQVEMLSEQLLHRWCWTWDRRICGWKKQTEKGEIETPFSSSFQIQSKNQSYS